MMNYHATLCLSNENPARDEFIRQILELWKFEKRRKKFSFRTFFSFQIGASATRNDIDSTDSQVNGDAETSSSRSSWKTESNFVFLSDRKSKKFVGRTSEIFSRRLE